MSVLLDDDTIVLDGLDCAVPCTPGAEEPATVYATCRYCTVNAGFLCDAHLEHARAHADAGARWAGAIRCPACKTTAAGFDALFKVVPL